MKIKALISVLAGSCLMFAVQAQNANDDLIERIKPMGSVNIAGAQTETTENTGPRSGEEIYKSSCTNCHAIGVLGAPKTNVAADWSPRMEKGFDTVWQNAVKGIGQMPAMGACMDCNDDDIKAAIEYMIKDI